MLKNTVEIYYHIERHIVDSRAKAIDLEVATGSFIDGEFVRDGRSLIKLSIVNIQDQPELDMGGGIIIPAVTGRNWFDEQAAYIQSDHAEHLGKNDYNYLKDRLWSTVIDMGLIIGEII